MAVFIRFKYKKNFIIKAAIKKIGNNYKMAKLIGKNIYKKEFGFIIIIKIIFKINLKKLIYYGNRNMAKNTNINKGNKNDTDIIL